MIIDYEILKFAWWALVGVLLIGFAVTDGMDMGVGTLLPFLGKNDSERRIIINTVGPHWDGNQVWFITAGGAIFAAWPAVYAAAFSGFYLAMLLVLFALFFRPVGFDYRSKIENQGWRNAWDWGLFAGGFIPSLIFGVAFGNLLQGVPFHLDEFLRVTYDAKFIWALLPLLNPFAILAGLISVAMLAGHGSTWLQMRADEVVAARARQLASMPVLQQLCCSLLPVCGSGRATSTGSLSSASQPMMPCRTRSPSKWRAKPVPCSTSTATIQSPCWLLPLAFSAHF